ncbi:hypothetical protein A1Q1_02209 [Trichosporon asahii var. asahii CBS 2479]|uniref:C3H1-type domain-containing protein n=1 Tax=Trichosporon asahii var. asahii (strain ATCC 90039 / CBS 2479 / JCM 2466 / KCTC 7840 / NBRC 103889/ NCYC 2677 / UAMH 7654) TaxID=1186058 RepID=J6EVZ5_TRIAS|nr:hypothetical protein A1Q1_02209 [Trichosporon asahii var. asahii CBS 2479]EJT48789.1 hypothetical protein A1Q1_02209 [Trichosporon asahii var. asahii CBS 2479]
MQPTLLSPRPSQRLEGFRLSPPWLPDTKCTQVEAAEKKKKVQSSQALASAADGSCGSWSGPGCCCLAACAVCPLPSPFALATARPDGASRNRTSHSLTFLLPHFSTSTPDQKSPLPPPPLSLPSSPPPSKRTPAWFGSDSESLPHRLLLAHAHAYASQLRLGYHRRVAHSLLPPSLYSLTHPLPTSSSGRLPLSIRPRSGAYPTNVAALSELEVTQFKKFQSNTMSVEQQQQQQHAAQEGSAQAQQAQAPTNAAAPETEAADLKSEVKSDANVAAVEAGVAALSIPQPQAELHRACAEGRLEDVRSILGRGLDALETLDVASGCTPIVLAIQNGHADVVRELLSAGAIVPPPAVTMDPTMLQVLGYSQPMYGVPPPFQMGPPQFFQPGMFPPNGGHPRGSPNGGSNGAANLPPAEVAKTIPCRNFPNCKYGNSCMFFHPPGPGFYPGGPGFAPNFVPYPPGAAPFFPGAQEFVPSGGAPAAEGSQPPAGEANAAPAEGSAAAPASENTQHDSIPAPSNHVGSALSPAFVPGAMPSDAPNGAPYPYANGGPMSPSMMPIPPPPMPSDPSFYANSQPQFQGYHPNGYNAHGRRQSFGQFANGGGKPFHGKKPSFSGGPKPWGPGGRMGGSSHLGQWKDGNPPPCAFFREGKCRNGEYCKFPHMDADGNDCRHPDVVRGIIPPMPTRPPPRHGMRMMGGHYDPSQRMHFQNKAAAAAAAANANGGDSSAATPAGEEGASANAASPATPASEKDVSGSTASLPPKPSAPVTPVSRSASGPGVARVHANGVNSRAHSPNSAGARRGPRGYANGHANGSRSSSSGDKKPIPPQRVPRADEFPALGLGGATTPTERREPSWGNKTGSQVLQAPAPAKPVTPKEEAPATPASEEPKAEEKVEEKPVAAVEPVEQKEAAEPQVTMDSDSEDGAVIVSVSTTPNPEASKPKVSPTSAAAAVSFASVAGTVIPEAIKA